MVRGAKSSSAKGRLLRSTRGVREARWTQIGSRERLAAILAADVASYSRLMDADEEGTHAALIALRREVSDPKVAQHRGHDHWRRVIGRIRQCRRRGAVRHRIAAPDGVAQRRRPE